MGVEAAAGVVLVGKIIAQKDISLYDVRSVLQKVWSFDRHLGVVELAPNTFLVEVSSSGTRDRVL